MILIRVLFNNLYRCDKCVTTVNFHKRTDSCHCYVWKYYLPVEYCLVEGVYIIGAIYACAIASNVANKIAEAMEIVILTILLCQVFAFCKWVDVMQCVSMQASLLIYASTECEMCIRFFLERVTQAHQSAFDMHKQR